VKCQQQQPAASSEDNVVAASSTAEFCMGDLVGRAERARPAGKKVSDLVLFFISSTVFLYVGPRFQPSPHHFWLLHPAPPLPPPFCFGGSSPLAPFLQFSDAPPLPPPPNFPPCRGGGGPRVYLSMVNGSRAADPGAFCPFFSPTDSYRPARTARTDTFQHYVMSLLDRRSATSCTVLQYMYGRLRK
jgi:hypothetical protein